MNEGADADTAHISPVGDRGLWRNRDFLVPYLAESQSIAGDQIGRVALSILVFDRTGSAAWTALTYALTFLPAILGGIVLGGVGDRFPRVWVMVATDVFRAALFLAVAVRGVPLPVVVGLVAVTFFVGPAFTAAMVSRLAATLAPDRFRAASGIRMITSQATQVAGFAAGGIIVAVVHPRVALVIDAATFAVSAAVVAVALGRDRSRVPAGPPAGEAATPAADPVPAPSLWSDPLRPLILLVALAGFFVVPEGLAVPVAHDLGASSRVAGLLLAAGPLGSAVGAALLVTFIPPRRSLTVARVMAIGCGAPLIATAALSAWPLVLVCWALSGALWAFQVDVAAALMQVVQDGARARVVSRASAVLLGVQGVGLIVFGAVGEWLGSDWAVSLAGLLGVGCALVIALPVLSGRPARMDGPDPSA